MSPEVIEEKDEASLGMARHELAKAVFGFESFKQILRLKNGMEPQNLSIFSQSIEKLKKAIDLLDHHQEQNERAKAVKKVRKD